MRKLLIINIILSASLFSLGQDVFFSLPNVTPIYNNPSFTGALGDLRLVNLFKNQHGLLSGDFNTDYFSVDHYYNNHGFGLSFFADRAGLAALSKTEVSFNYAYYIQLEKKWAMSSGVSSIVGNSSLKINGAVFGDQLNVDYTVSDVSSESLGNGNRFYTDANWGINVFTDNFWISSSVGHILKPDLYSYSSNFKSARKLTLQTGYVMDIRNPKIYNPNKENLNKYIISGSYTRQGNVERATVENKVVYNSITGVISVSNISVSDIRVNGFNVGAGYSFEGASVMYAYEFFLGNTSSIGGSHELMLGFRLNRDNNSRRPSFNNKKSLNTFCPMQ